MATIWGFMWFAPIWLNHMRSIWYWCGCYMDKQYGYHIDAIWQAYD